MFNFLGKIFTSLLVVVGIHHNAPAVQPSSQFVPVVTQQQSPAITPAVVAPAVSSTVAVPPKKVVVSAVTKTVSQPTKPSAPVTIAPTTTSTTLTPEQISNNAIEAGEAAYAEQQREQQAAAQKAAMAAAQAQADAAAQADYQHEMLVNSKQYKLDAINKQIADLNAKYAKDKIALTQNPSGEMESAYEAQLNNLYNTYLDNYNLLEAQYQEVETSD